MELLPPVGWADVATKHDLDALGAATKRDLDALGAATKRDIGALGAATKRDLDALEERVLLRTDKVVLEAVGGLRRDVATWLFAGMGIQTATLGLLISLT